MTELPTLYSRAKTGKISAWRIFVELKHDIPHVTTHYGYVDGEIQTTAIPVVEGKNLGRSNQTTPIEQAFRDAKSKWDKKKLENYVEDINEVDNVALLPMLAHKFKDRKKNLKWPVFGQAKFNGCLHHTTQIQTDKGVKTIGEIVQKQLQVSVLSFNLETKELEYQPIVNWFNNGTAPISDWIELKLEYGALIKCTKNHKIYTQRGWVSAEELDENSDTICIDSSRINSLQCKGIEYKYYFPTEGYIQPIKTHEFSKFKKNKIRHVNVEVFSKYDIEVSKNHNYFANGVLVHNCRCLAHIKNGEVKFTSRKNKEFNTLNHIETDLLNVFGGQDLILDGEIFHPDLPLQGIISRLKREKTDRKDLESTKLQYWVYDIVWNNTPYSERYKFLCQYTKTVFILAPHLKAVETILLANENELIQFNEHNLGLGFEGSMVRSLNGLYVPDTRSNDLLKYKDFTFQEEEFVIVGGHEAMGRDEGSVVFECETKAGKQFSVRPKGTLEQRRYWFRTLEELKGKLLTVKFAEWTPDGLPFHPTGLLIRDYE